MLQSTADIVLFGGAAGSLKSFTMLVDAAQGIEHPLYHAILFRRTFPELEASLIRQSRELYYDWGGKYNESKKQWTFPSGAVIQFGHCQRDDEIYNYMGAEYSYIGFDEATHFSEFPIRYMLSRLRCKDPSVRLKMRLATNPGNVGHKTMMSIFMGDTCVHCLKTSDSREPFQVYNDAKWPSDGQLIGLTTCFIPGRVDDHDIFGQGGERYAEKLKALPETYRKALLEGCWALFEGQYFQCWDQQRMVVPADCLFRVGRDEFGQTAYFEASDVRGEPVRHPEYWWPHWVAVDWGFAHHTVAYLATKAPNGVTYVLGEFFINRCKPQDLGETLKRMWYSDTQRVITASYLSPDAWAKRQDDHTIADQLAEGSGVYFERASNDRVGGAMVLYNLLESGLLKVTTACPKLIASIPTRTHDEDRPEDVLKTDDIYDDVYDAVRYLIYSHMGNAQKPREVLLQEALTSKDPSIRHIQYMLANQKLEQQETEVISYNPRWRSGSYQ